MNAIQDVDLSVDAGVMVAVMGPSGSGKSTLLTIAGSLEEPTSGEVFIDGTALLKMSRNEKARLRRRTIGYVFQDFNLLAGLTAVENVSLPLELDGMSLKEARAHARSALEAVGLTDLGDRFPDDLSGGEQQRVAIARALVPGPRLIVADEPTGNLDPATAWEIMQLLLRINANGSTVVMATHNREIVDLLRRRVVAIENGRVVRDDRSGTYHENLPASALRA